MTMMSGAASRTCAGFVDAQGTAAEVLTIQGLNGSLRLRRIHFHETETTRTPGIPVVDQLYGTYRTVCLEHVPDFFLSGSEGKVTHVNRLDHDIDSVGRNHPWSRQGVATGKRIQGSAWTSGRPATGPPPLIILGIIRKVMGHDPRPVKMTCGDAGRRRYFRPPAN